jgi:hypothetical protein
MEIIIYLHHYNVDDTLYKMSLILYMYLFLIFCILWDPLVIGKNCVNLYSYYDFLVQKIIKQMPPAEYSSWAEQQGLDSVKSLLLSKPESC